MIVDVYDSSRKEWRFFSVIPFDETYKPKCGGVIHQFNKLMVRCLCGEITKKYLNYED